MNRQNGSQRKINAALRNLNIEAPLRLGSVRAIRVAGSTWMMEQDLSYVLRSVASPFYKSESDKAVLALDSIIKMLGGRKHKDVKNLLPGIESLKDVLNKVNKSASWGHGAFFELKTDPCTYNTQYATLMLPKSAEGKKISKPRKSHKQLPVKES